MPATPHTVYRIGSITKQFTSASVMQLVESGQVELDESIGAYVPSLPARLHLVTVRQLLNHTSGIPSYTDVGPRWLKRIGEPMTPDTLVAFTTTDPFNFPPGTNWRYNNTGYVILGMLLEKVTGKPYAQYLDERLFKPLGLTHTTYCDNARIIPHRAQGYAKDGNGWRNAAFIDMSQPFSAGALCSTALDLAHWNQMLAVGRVVSAASYREMTTPTHLPDGHSEPFGFGLAMGPTVGRDSIFFGGAIDGFRSRVSAPQQRFDSGESIPLKIEIENVRETEQAYTPAVHPAQLSLRVTLDSSTAILHPVSRRLQLFQLSPTQTARLVSTTSFRAMRHRVITILLSPTAR